MSMPCARGARHALLAVGVALVAAGSSGCEREARPLDSLPGRISGPAAPAPLTAGGPRAQPPATSPFQENAWGVGEGKRLFDQFNCSGCHAHGGGGMGPPLMDDRWIYGSHPRAIYDTILEGRPNGMPSFGGRIADAQLWQLVAYVQSMSGQVPVPSLPGRSDHMRAGTPENARPAQPPERTAQP